MILIELIPIIPEIFLSLTGMALLLWGAFSGNKATTPISYAAGVALVLTMVAVIALSYVNLPDLGGPYIIKATVLGGHFGISAFTHFIKTLILLSALASLVLSHHFLKTSHLARPEYPVLVLFATLGMMLMVSAESLLGLYMGLELMSLTLYVLASFARDNTKSTEAGLKYFVLGALASGLLLFGVSYVYGASGSIVFDTLHKVIVSDKPPIEIVLGFVFILAGLAFKISAVPFHMWTPDVYEGAPTPVTAFFAAAPKLAGMAILIKVLYQPFIAMPHQAMQILLVLSIASMAVGSFAAIVQTNIKRLLAYSSIGHVGFALLGLVAAGSQGVEATLLYLFIYLPMTLGAFAVVLSLRRKDVYLEQISDLAGLSKSRPALAAIMSVFMFSMIGIPPLAGFFGKLYVFTAAVQAGYVWLAVLGVCLSVVGAFYYLRIIKVMYFDPPHDHFDRVPSWGVTAVMTCCVMFIMVFILQPDIAADIVKRAAEGLISRPILHE